MITVQEINDVEQLADQRLLWNSLLARTPDASFFQSLDWLTAYWRHFGTNQRLRVLIVVADGEPIGILPLMVAREQTRLGRLRVLTYPLEEWGTFYGPLGPSPSATLVCGLAHIRQTPRDWQLLDLRWVRADGPDGGRTEQALERAGLTAQRKVWDHVSVVAVTGTWEGYWAGRGGWRRKVRHSERHLAQSGEIQYVRYRPPGAAYGDADPGWSWYDHCEGIAARSWQSSITDGNTLCHPTVRPFLRDVHQAAAHAGAADISLLLVGGQPAAFMYGYVYRGSVFVLRTGYDAQERFKGAGSVLLTRLIQDSFVRGDHTINMGAGSLEWKRYWHTSVETTYRYTHFPATEPRAQLIRCKRGLETWLRSRAQREPQAGPAHATVVGK